MHSFSGVQCRDMARRIRERVHVMASVFLTFSMQDSHGRLSQFQVSDIPSCALQIALPEKQSLQKFLQTGINLFLFAESNHVDLEQAEAYVKTSLTRFSTFM